MTTQNFTQEMKRFGVYLCQAREQKGLTQAKVAKMAGHNSPQFISNIERGTVLPPLPLLRVLSACYGVKPQSLFNRFQGVRHKKDLIEFMAAPPKATKVKTDKVKPAKAAKPKRKGKKK